MIRRPPRSTLFPTRRSSDLSQSWGHLRSIRPRRWVPESASHKRARLESTAMFRTTEPGVRSEEHTSELQSQSNLVCRLLLEKKKTNSATANQHQQTS